MQRNLTSRSTYTDARKQGRKLSPVLTGGAALLLAVAAGVATWQGIAQRETSTTVTESSVAQGATTATQPAIARTASDDLTVYVVESQAEATSLMESIAEGNRILDQFGKPPFNADVIVVTSTEEEEAILRANADADAIRASMGLSPIAVIDLRGR